MSDGPINFISSIELEEEIEKNQEHQKTNDHDIISEVFERDIKFSPLLKVKKN
jgi:hypothetical protein